MQDLRAIDAIAEDDVLERDVTAAVTVPSTSDAFDRAELTFASRCMAIRADR